MMHVIRTKVVGSWLIGAHVLLTQAAHADPVSATRADELFRAGKEQLAEKDYARACPTLLESFRLDPATGTLLALAICYEREGKLASAYREYSEVVARSVKDARADREKAARDRLSALAPRVSRLTISIAEQTTPPTEVRLNDIVVAAEKLGKAIPVDGGKQTIEASAPGKKTWRTEVNVADSLDTQAVVVPALEAQAAAKPILVAAPPPHSHENPVETPRPQPTPIEEPHPHTTLRWLSYGAIGAGVVGLGASTYFTIHALDEKHDSKAGCFGNTCTADARRDRLAARRAGNAATITGVAGGVFAATGVVLLVLSAQSSSSERPPDHAPWVGAPWLTAGAAGASLNGSF